MLAHQRDFVGAGGTVIFLGARPMLAVGQTFLCAGPADISFATLREPNAAITPTVLSMLPKPDLTFDAEHPLVSYNHRRLHDADVYFLFNSGDEKATLHATLASHGTIQSWDPMTGKVSTPPFAPFQGDHVTVPLELDPWSTRVIVVGGHAPAN